MSLFDALVLGILQGFTEFLPISSSGHLVLGQKILGINMPGNTLEVVLHVGTLFSILFIFRKDLTTLLVNVKDSSTRKFIGYLIAGTVPAALIGLLFKDLIENAFDSTLLVGGMLIVNALFLFSTHFIHPGSKLVDLPRGVLIGIAQALAILPGISRSGSTISTAMVLGISPSDAARFSFLLAIPALVGAGLLTALDIEAVQTSMSVLATGFISSFISGLVALKWLLGLLKSGKFFWFGFYCLGIGILTMAA